MPELIFANLKRFSGIEISLFNEQFGTSVSIKFTIDISVFPSLPNVKDYYLIIFLIVCC